MENINNLIMNFSGNIYDLCFYVLKESENKAETFELVCKELLRKPSDGDIEIPQYFTEDEIDKYKSIDGEIVDGFINATIKRCNAGVIAVDAFYSSLWAAFSSWFTDEKELAFAMYYTLIDKRIPYMYLGMPLSMNNDRFKELIQANKENLDKISYINRSGYRQHTERASLLLNCLDSISDYESKVVVLAQAMKVLNKSGVSIQASSGIDGLEDLLKILEKRVEEIEAADE